LTLEELLSTSNLYTKNIKCARNLNFLPFEHLSQLNNEVANRFVSDYEAALFTHQSLY
jgi:hypothetical protein